MTKLDELKILLSEYRHKLTVWAGYPMISHEGQVAELAVDEVCARIVKLVNDNIEAISIAEPLPKGIVTGEIAEIWKAIVMQASEVTRTVDVCPECNFLHENLVFVPADGLHNWCAMCPSTGKRIFLYKGHGS